MLKRSQFLLLIVLFGLTVLPGLFLIHPVEAQITGANWVGSYYNNLDLSGAPIVSNVPYPSGLNFNFGAGSPITGVGPNNFSATFTSTQTLTAGLHRFTMRYNDGIRVFINNQSVFADFTQTMPDTTGTCATRCRERTFELNLPGGATSMRVDWVKYDGEAILQFQWAPPTTPGGSTITPTGPTSTPIPAATGQVIRVRGLAIRTGPYLGASLIGVAKPGVAYPILERNRDEGLFVWYRITAGDNTGWVSGRYFEVAGTIDVIPFTGSIFDQIDNSADISVVGVTRSIMNLRRRPSDRTQILDKVPWGAEVPVIGRTVQGGNNFWLQVRYNGKVGWIFAPYVGLRGIVDAVPVR